MGKSLLPLRWDLAVQEMQIGLPPELVHKLTSGRDVSTLMLLHLVTPDVQIIDGEIYGKAEGRLIVRVRAIRGAWWDIFSSDNGILQAVSTSYDVIANLDAHGNKK